MKMRNRAPILVGGFQGGGSSVVVNLLASHPDTSWIRETQLIMESRDLTRGERLLARLLLGDARRFDLANLEDRAPLGAAAARLLDAILHRRKLGMLDHPAFRYRRQDEVYTREQVRSTRLILKHLNGLALLNRPLMRTYPDAVCIHIARHPVPLYESMKRRGRVGSAAEFLALYGRVTGCMRRDARELEAAHVVRYEDLIEDVPGFVRDLYARAGLDLALVPVFRLALKPRFVAPGVRSTEKRSHVWLGIDRLDEAIDPEMNRYHAENLDASDVRAVLEGTVEAREALGYDDTGTSGPVREP